MIFLGFLIVSVLFVLSVALSDLNKLVIYWDAPTILYILVGVVGYVLLFGGEKFARGMKTFFAFSFPTDDNAVETGRFFLRLAEFTLAWGLLGMFIGTVLAMSDLDPNTIGMPFAVSVLSFLYATGLAVFVFLPIGLRLSPPTMQLSASWRLSIRQLVIGFGCFFLMRCLVVVLLLAIAQKPDFRKGPIHSDELGNVVLQAAVAINPADPQGDYSPFTHISQIIIY
jgi:hypothetical protein